MRSITFSHKKQILWTIKTAIGEYRHTYIYTSKEKKLKKTKDEEKCDGGRGWESETIIGLLLFFGGKLHFSFIGKLTLSVKWPEYTHMHMHINRQYFFFEGPSKRYYFLWKTGESHNEAIKIIGCSLKMRKERNIIFLIQEVSVRCLKLQRKKSVKKF